MATNSDMATLIKTLPSRYFTAQFRSLSRPEVSILEAILRVVTAAAFIGHGAFGAVMAKEAWFGYFGAVGINAATVEVASLIPLVGWFEIALGVFILVKPICAVLLGMVLWKVGIEFLRPLAGEPMWEFIERASNMIAPLALIYVRGWPTSLREWLR
jgi:hypothetical protein